MRLEVRSAVLRVSVGDDDGDTAQLQVLLVREPESDNWALPGGPIVGDAELADTAEAQKALQVRAARVLEGRIGDVSAAALSRLRAAAA